MSFSWSISLFLILVFFLTFVLVKKESELMKASNSQFECGFSLMNPPQLPFSFQFFLVSLLFLIFDIEIALILAYPLEPKTTQNLMIMGSFLMVLTIGLIYEWQKSKINWSK